MAGRPISFEVQVLKEKRWILSQVVGDEAGAIAFADNLLSKKTYEAVRVVRDYHSLDGTHRETVISEKTSESLKPTLTLVPISEAPLCTELQDAYALPSRQVIGRLFRRYLDEVTITPTELLHSARELKRLSDKDRLLMSAVDQVAGLQAPEGGDAAKARRDFLHKSWEQLAARARKAAPEKPPKNLSLQDLAKAARSAEDPDYQTLVLMSAQLIEQRGWPAKLDMVLAWAMEEGTAAHKTSLDGLIADLLLPAETIQDLLGHMPNLGAALCHMCDLTEGKAQSAKLASEAFTTVNKMFAEGKLPQSQQALLNRVMRELRGTNPLSRTEPGQEYEVFVRVLYRMVTYEGVFGGPAMAESLAHRCFRLHNAGGLYGLLKAIDDIAGTLGDRCRRTIYFMALLACPSAAGSFGPTLLLKLEEMADDPQSIDAWAPARLPPRDRMVALTSCHRLITACSVLPDGLRTKLANRTDQVLTKYLEEDQVIEKIDKPEDPLAFRALRLVKFCCSGVLIKGKALDLAHQRILGHLRQAQFEEKFLASIPDKTQADRHLREFHKLLMESGFKG